MSLIYNVLFEIQTFTLLAVKSISNLFRKLLYCYFKASTDIDRLRAILVLCRKKYPFSSISNVNKLT